MRKIKRFGAYFAIVLFGAASMQCFPEDDMMTVCYYGVTQVVPPKIAKRLIKIGATSGACGESTAQPAPAAN